MTGFSDIGAVVIGRNEGARLKNCLQALQGRVGHMIYVDSGSTDDSQEVARKAGARVLELDNTLPFTAARARNAGLAFLRANEPALEFVQFVDGDCEIQPGWIETAHTFLITNPVAAVACGRRRERFPDASVYNGMIDREWDTPIGQTRSCGGDALMRIAALKDVDGFNPALIAGEEPELCVRLRKAGWAIWRLDAEMTLHDAALTRFGQWWQRARRAGYAYAEGVAMHGRAPEHHNVAPLRRTVFWGMVLPLVTLVGALFTPLALLLLLIWPAQVIRLNLKGESWTTALFFTMGKLPEALGALRYWRQRLAGSHKTLIEYK